MKQGICGKSVVSGYEWHGLLHRREPDFSNAKYWFRRVGQHPVFEPLHEMTAKLAEEGPEQAKGLPRQKKWDAFGFVDLCEQALRQHGMLEELCRKVQHLEWELLFDYCYKQAIRQ